MELVDYDIPTKDFPFPSDERKVITGPDDLTRGQNKELQRQLKAHENLDNDDWLAMVFTYWASLPSASWNLSQHGVALPLTADALESRLSKEDFGGLSIEVTRHLYPYLFEESTATESAPPDEDSELMDGLVAEGGAAAPTEPVAGSAVDPNE